METVSRLNLPELFGLGDAGLDDAGTDADGNLYVSDGVNGRVYKLSADGSFDSFSLNQTSEQSLNLAVAEDSTFSLADTRDERVTRYSASGEYLGEFPAAGAICLCPGPDGSTYVLSDAGGIERIDVYDSFGFPVEALPAPARQPARLDPGIVNLDSDLEGNVYVSYGMPPYRIWKVKSDGSDVEVWNRDWDFPEDALLIADIALDRNSGILWALLATKQTGQQIMEAFSNTGEFLGTALVPHSQTLFGVICAMGDSEICLVDTGTGPGSGDVLRLSISL